MTLYSSRAITPGLSAPSPFQEQQGANPHVRWDPLHGEPVTYVAYRQHRTYQPAPEYNPLAVTLEQANPTEPPAGEYQIAVFDNWSDIEWRAQFVLEGTGARAVGARHPSGAGAGGRDAPAATVPPSDRVRRSARGPRRAGVLRAPPRPVRQPDALRHVRRGAAALIAGKKAAETVLGQRTDRAKTVASELTAAAGAGAGNRELTHRMISPMQTWPARTGRVRGRPCR